MPGDLHAALEVEAVDKRSGGGVEFTLVRLRDSKTKLRFSLHGHPITWSTAGLQTTDALSILRFTRQRCPFSYDDGFCAEVSPELDLAAFATAFGSYFDRLREAERHLNQCGLFLPQPEGWGALFGRASGGRAGRISDYISGDGHRSPESSRIAESEDENFRYVFSWIAGGNDKGWVTHYHPKHSPLSSELEAAFEFLSLGRFQECPQFDFEPCRWRFTAYQERGDSFFDRNTEVAHSWFGAHAEHFSPGLQNLVEAHTAMEPFGFRLLPQMQTAERRREADMGSRTLAPTTPHEQRSGGNGYDFDVAISFAGTERLLAETLARRVQDAGHRVFYDDFYPEMLWGKDLPVFFDDIYRKVSRYCVVFVSVEYNQRMWTNQERQSAVARQLEERGREYILPIQVDDSDLPGVPPTVGRMSLSERTIEEIARLLIEKLAG